MTYSWDANVLPPTVVTGFYPEMILINADSVVLCEFKVSQSEPVALTTLLGTAPAAHEAPSSRESAPASAAVVALEVRDLSGLSAEKLGDIFPIERESYQRWISGKNTPSEANLERLLALRHFLRAVADRVDSPKTWLLTSLTEGAMSSSPYDLLRSGNMVAAWEAVSKLPSRTARAKRRASDGSDVVVITSSVRGRPAPTRTEELDDYDDWLSEDE